MYLSAPEIKSALTYPELIPVIRTALIDYSAGRVTQPLRTMLPAGQSGRFGVMSAVYGSVMGTKMVSIYPENAALGLPTHSSVIQLFDAETGLPLATLDGDVITERRTAAVSALAAELLAPKHTKVLALLGAGVQAHAHLEALRHIHAFDRVYVWSRTHEAAEKFASQSNAMVADSVIEAVTTADIIVAATSAKNPIVPGHSIQESSLVIAVGAVHPQARELDDVVMQGALIVESKEAANKESGDIILSGASIYAELGELLAGHVDLPTSSRRVFKSVGIAVEDVAAAHLAYRLLSQTARNPAGTLNR